MISSHNIQLLGFQIYRWYTYNYFYFNSFYNTYYNFASTITTKQTPKSYLMASSQPSYVVSTEKLGLRAAEDFLMMAPRLIAGAFIVLVVLLLWALWTGRCRKSNFTGDYGGAQRWAGAQRTDLGSNERSGAPTYKDHFLGNRPGPEFNTDTPVAATSRATGAAQLRSDKSADASTTEGFNNKLSDDSLMTQLHGNNATARVR